MEQFENVANFAKYLMSYYLREDNAIAIDQLFLFGNVI
jgi:hypothetical protein